MVSFLLADPRAVQPPEGDRKGIVWNGVLGHRQRSQQRRGRHKKDHANGSSQARLVKFMNGIGGHMNAQVVYAKYAQVVYAKLGGLT